MGVLWSSFGLKKIGGKFIKRKRSERKLSNSRYISLSSGRKDREFRASATLKDLLKAHGDGCVYMSDSLGRHLRTFIIGQLVAECNWN